ncbi:hypothetical protein QJS10_CPB13g00879 [Acorus calamus]|uniref:MICOS complex subunit Mic10 n=1 Tax=Acorus calamus TaxID=4465 RepID=A0AAV9DH00_ACOCL|nr:hypothetical protein QJS10_CPB13g00879 [Acorus calamus]
MATEKKQQELIDLDAKYDACVDLTVRRFVYSSLGGAFGGLLLFRSPVTRWASVAFAAGVGVGSAYTECRYIMDGHPTNLASPIRISPISSAIQDEPALTEKDPN